MKLSKITNKQSEIIELVYKHRFLNRIKIQAFLGHKDKKTINLWLRDLKARGYIDWIYSPDDFALKTKPAIYYLALESIRLLKTSSEHPVEELRKRYRESSRSQSYIDRCILLADCCLTLEQARDEVSRPQSWYFYETEADYLEDGHYYHFLLESELVHPQLCFSKELYEGGGDTSTENNYLLEVFDAGLPRYRIKKRLTDYVTYLDEEGGVWKDTTGSDKLPIILLVCPRTSDLIYAKRRTRGLIADLWDDDDKPVIKFATLEKLKAHGVLGEIWEEA
jgi:hypothetical protein